jgi:hypothetical protein
MPALLAEPHGNGAADAARCTGDQRDPLRHRTPP